MNQQGSLRRRYKSRSGCITCKKRKLKCDEAEPACTRCVRAHLICPGCVRPVKWSTKYEIDYGPLTYAGPSSNQAPDSS
ncbi:hypothetical protein BKA59DRAFT_320535 [Fusarium tricinctum]|uniref:Zn(2)-C6 fungal-type domain-containing protein n=1 Tax=Fusarium tricinctum TaxID=61284 RepID=A0A8K0RMX7_9HYPO|nr:hypothetical protein BKA59DRAFT_320535 [Fusarium tricinctum]